MEHDKHFLTYENIMRNYPRTVMTKTWNPQFPGPLNASKVYTDVRKLLPEKVTNEVINSPRLKSLIDSMYAGEKDVERAHKEIVDILVEISMGRSLLAIRSFGVLIEYMVRKVHMSLFINCQQVDRIKAIGARNPVIYLPTHRSYADFILFSFLCFYFDMEVPQVAAGMDFKHMKGVGKMMSKAGAFYMRRKFADDKLYWNVFKEFIRTLVTGFESGVEFFIEGTRSRTMKALTPKIGLLSMALEPFFMGQVVDITIIPVSISYERPLEERLFAYELLGVPKPKESTMGLIKSMFALGNQYFGSTYVHYHEPLSVREFFGERANRFRHAVDPAHVQQLTRDDLALVQELAEHVIDQQQRHNVIQAFNLVAVYLSFRSQTSAGWENIDVTHISEQTLILGRLFGRLGATTNVDASRIREQIENTLKTHESLLLRDSAGCILLNKPTIDTNAIHSVKFKAHRLGDDTMRECLPLVNLQLSVNPCLYWTAMPALTLASLRRLQHSRSGTERVTVDILRSDVNYLRNVFATEFVFIAPKETEDFDRTLLALQDFNLLTITEDGRVLEQSKAEGVEHSFGDILLSTVTPYLWTYLQVINTVAQYFPSIPFTENQCLVRAQSGVEERLRMGSKDVHPYCLCLEAISTALNQFTRTGVLIKTKESNGSYKYNVNLPELHAIHCHLQHLCNALELSFAITRNTPPTPGVRAKL